MKSKLQAVSLTLCLTSLWNYQAQSAESTWRFNPTGSSVSFRVKNMGLSADGKFTKVSGEVNYNGEDLAAATVQANIGTGSIDTGIGMRDNHLKSKDFFDVSKFPEAQFRSTKIEVQPSGDFKVIGTLSLHGISQDVTLDAKPLTKKVDQAGHSHLLTSASTTLLRKSFGIGGMTAATIADNVKIDVAVDLVRD